MNIPARFQHSSHITHIDNKEDIPYLRNKLFDVNIRLFNSSTEYRGLINRACDHIGWLCMTKMQGYKLPHGMSAANAGIPWNIIAFALNRDTKNAYSFIMMNPKILKREGAIVDTESNCGSLTLERPITIKRHEKVFVGWFDRDSKYNEKYFDRDNHGFTIQHEIDHNLGILITDRIETI